MEERVAEGRERRRSGSWKGITSHEFWEFRMSLLLFPPSAAIPDHSPIQSDKNTATAIVSVTTPVELNHHFFALHLQ
jgi:hypothetical protein